MALASVQMAGPYVLGYGVAGIIAFLIMRQLGRIVVDRYQFICPCLSGTVCGASSLAGTAGNDAGG